MRIISGSARGRVLKSPKGMLTRPTLDRTRESLFNILENSGGLRGAAVLDIFAGTGALGCRDANLIISLRTRRITKIW